MIITPTIKRCLSFTLLAFASASFAADDYGYYDDAVLQAPDVDFYLGLQASKNNLKYLEGEQEYGFNLLLGAYFNDVNILDMRYGVELGYNVHGETKDQSTRLLTNDDFRGQPLPTGVDIDNSSITNTSEIRVSTLTFGMRLEGNRFYTRLGGALYNYHSREQQIFDYVCVSPGACMNPEDRPSSSETKTAIAPYAGFGVKIPLEKHLKFTVGFDAYRIDSHRLTSVNIGLQYTN